MAKTEQEIKIRNDEVEWEPRPTLGSADYASAEVWEQEREKIWWGEWVCAGRTEEVPNPGDYIVRDIAGESVFIVRNDAGELHAFYNVCSHRGTKFLDDIDGTQNVRKAFVCPYHAWTFDLNGQLIGSPNVREDEHFDRSDHPLYDIAIDHYAGFLFVNLTTGGPKETLLESLTDGAESITVFDRFKMDELRVGVRLVYEVKANWKIVVENYNECLHCPQVHPELVQVIPLFRFGEVWDEEIPDDGNRMVAGATVVHADRRERAAEVPGPRARGLRDVLRQLPVPEHDAEPAPGLRDGLHRLSEGAEPHHRGERVHVPSGDDRRSRAVQARAHGRVLGHDQQAGLGDLRTRADRRQFARLHAWGLPAPGPVPVLVQRGMAPRDGSPHPGLTIDHPVSSMRILRA